MYLMKEILVYLGAERDFPPLAVQGEFERSRPSQGSNKGLLDSDIKESWSAAGLGKNRIADGGLMRRILSKGK